MLVNELEKKFLTLSAAHIDVDQVGRFITNKGLEQFFAELNSRTPVNEEECRRSFEEWIIQEFGEVQFELLDRMNPMLFRVWQAAYMRGRDV